MDVQVKLSGSVDSVNFERTHLTEASDESDRTGEVPVLIQKEPPSAQC